jgi:hypothetical protein
MVTTDTAENVIAALRKFVESGRPDPFVTYADFAREHGFSATYPLEPTVQRSMQRPTRSGMIRRSASI